MTDYLELAQRAIADMHAELDAARERLAAAAWELTDPAHRHLLVELVGPRRLTELELDRSAELESNDVTLVLAADPPCFACLLELGS